MNDVRLVYQVDYEWKFDWPDTLKLKLAAESFGTLALRISPDVQTWSLWATIISEDGDEDGGHYMGCFPFRRMAELACEWLKEQLAVTHWRLQVRVPPPEARRESAALLSAVWRECDPL